MRLIIIVSVAYVEAAPAACAESLSSVCRRAGECHLDNAHCPPVKTDPTCGEHPHSGRDGSLLTWGLTFRTSSAQECCDKCKTHSKKCNSWTFCGLPVCWGLDTGHNHTFGECWLRRLLDVRANNTFRQRGRYTDQWLEQHRHARPGCRRNEPWACSPTHVPYTSGALGGPAYDPSEAFVTGGGWGNVFVLSESDFLKSGPPPTARRRAARRLGRRRGA